MLVLTPRVTNMRNGTFRPEIVVDGAESGEPTASTDAAWEAACDTVELCLVTGPTPADGTSFRSHGRAPSAERSCRRRRVPAARPVRLRNPLRALRSLPWSAVIVLLLGAGAPAIAGQAPPGFGGILGVILNSVLTNQARQEWQNRPIADYSCLAAHNVSADQLASNGIGPNDPRVQKILRAMRPGCRQCGQGCGFARSHRPKWLVQS